MEVDIQRLEEQSDEKKLSLELVEVRPIRCEHDETRDYTSGVIVSTA